MLKTQLADDGFAVVERVLPDDMVAQLCEAISHAGTASASGQRRRATYAIRNLFEAVPRTRALVNVAPIQSLILRLLGEDAFVTRAIMFDKNPGANWTVPWHQDLTIAVRGRPACEPAGFGPWSVKEDVHHVQPPAWVLESMLTLRVHLDDCDHDNAPLRVLPGSHRRGVLGDAGLLEVRRSSEPKTCTVKAGGALMMKPLIVHASSPAASPRHRRVIHLEWASVPLPHGMEWHRA